MFDFLVQARRLMGQRLSDRRSRPWGLVASPAQRLAPVVQEFEEALVGVTSPASALLRSKIRRAKTKSELWYFRVDVFNAVSQAYGQQEAQSRLGVLNDQFQSAGRRSGPIPL